MVVLNALPEDIKKSSSRPKFLFAFPAPLLRHTRKQWKSSWILIIRNYEVGIAWTVVILLRLCRVHWTFALVILCHPITLTIPRGHLCSPEKRSSPAFRTKQLFSFLFLWLQLKYLTFLSPISLIHKHFQPSVWIYILFKSLLKFHCACSGEKFTSSALTQWIPELFKFIL